MRDVDDIRSWVSQDYVGAAETSAAPGWRIVQHYRPDIRVLVVRRAIPDVVESVLALDMKGVCKFDPVAVRKQITELDRRLDQIEEGVPGALSVEFDDLDDEDVCARAFEHCLPYYHDHDWWASCAPVNIQADMPSLMRHHFAHKPQMERFGRLCRAELRSLREMGGIAGRPLPGQRPVDLLSVTIQIESFDAFWRDGQALFAEHAAEVGPRAGVMLDPNIPLAQTLERARSVQIMTARNSDGKMVGYLATLISPSLEDKSLVSAIQNTFFVTKAYRGIGLRLQRASIERIRARGVGELILRAGVRGSGARLSLLYERLGATEYGRLYNLILRAA